MTLGEIAQVAGGRLVGVEPDVRVSGSVEFDSRQVTSGGLFLALPGERVDGHDYTDTAVAAGAVASVVSRPVHGPSIEVADGYAALAALATHVAAQLPGTTVVGITGSSGKTSTKDLVAHLLRRLGPTVAPPGSFNNELGLPYTVLRADRATDYLVLEHSARGIGHIAYLTRIARPRIGVVLNVGSAHLGEFGSRGAIAQAKGELVEALPADGVAVLNADDPLVAAMAARTDARVLLVGRSPIAEVRATDVRLDDLGRASFTVVTHDDHAPVTLGLVGEHHVGNALAAAAVGLECGMSLDDVAVALAAARPLSRWRMEVTERPDGVVVINAASNANPESMAAALRALAAVERGGRRIAVLGTMAELGPDEDAEHDKVGRLAAGLGVARVVAVGPPARSIEQAAARTTSWAGSASWVPDVDAAVALLRAELRPGDAVLVKASRSAGLERVALAIADDSTLPADGTGAA